MELAWWQSLLLNVIASVFCGLSVSCFIYYKYLRHIPQENKRLIEELLNDRLSYETTNHNAIRDQLTPNNKHLSDEHRNLKQDLQEDLSRISSSQNSIRGSITDFRHYVELKDARRSALAEKEMDIAKTVDHLNALTILLAEQKVQLNAYEKEKQENERYISELEAELHNSKEHFVERKPSPPRQKRDNDHYFSR